MDQIQTYVPKEMDLLKFKGVLTVMKHEGLFLYEALQECGLDRTIFYKIVNSSPEYNKIYSDARATSGERRFVERLQDLENEPSTLEGPGGKIVQNSAGIQKRVKLLEFEQWRLRKFNQEYADEAQNQINIQNNGKTVNVNLGGAPLDLSE